MTSITNDYNGKYTLNETTYTYLPRTKCLDVRENVPQLQVDIDADPKLKSLTQCDPHLRRTLAPDLEIQPYVESDPRLYVTCVKCGIVFPARADNIYTLYY